jgi:ectoine hydroxylase-related dioxygenase (phytanoyl-CoA dioxygenase family)
VSGRRTTFVDERVNEQVDELGYAVLDQRLDDDDVHRLDALYRGVRAAAGDDDSGRFLPSMTITEPGLRTQLWDGVRELLAPVIDPLFQPGTAAVMGGSFVSKPASEHSARNPHQDPSVFDETRFVAISLWIPLSDSDADNGTLYVLGGSHRMGNHVRPPDVANFDDAVSEHALAHSVPLELRAGQVLVLDGALVHHSPPNRTTSERVACIGAVRPTGAAMYLMRSDHGEDTGVADLYRVEVDAFRSGNLMDPALDPEDLERRVPYRPATADDLERSLAGG